MSATVEYVVEDGVGVIRLRRPEVLNALDRETLGAFVETAETAAADPEVRVVVVTGGPDAFCTGEDLREAAQADVEAFRAQIDAFQRLATALRDAPKPVLAAVGGAAYGGGLEIAVDCDVRIAADNAHFGCPEPDWGMTITNGASVLLRRVVGDGWARELTLFGTVLDAETALRAGLVTRVVAPDELHDTAMEMARRAARAEPEALRLTKALLNGSEGRSWQAVLDAETEACVEGFTNPTTAERLQRFLTRKQS